MHQLTHALLMGASKKSGVVSTMSLFAAIQSTGSTITVPAYANPGDFAVLIDTAGAASFPSSVVPAGWDSLATGTFNDSRYYDEALRWLSVPKFWWQAILGQR